jgi:PiT family inorganic phosphate transporter
MMLSLALLLAALLLASANGANDNFKGVATLFGTGTADYRGALALATVSTALGSVAALLLARGLLVAFSGKGLVADPVLADPAFLPAVGLGAGATVLLATRVGIPISTTHALTGALVGAGLAAASGQVHLAVLGGKFLLPLLVSPVLALGATYLLYPLLSRLRLRFGVVRETCLCVGEERQVVAVDGRGVGVMAAVAPAEVGRITLHVGDGDQCIERYRGRLAGVAAQTVLDRLHYASAAAVGFARGLNDTPKIAALLLGVEVLNPGHGILVVAVAIAFGGLLGARRVAETMSHRITTMNHGQGFTANLITAFLVIVASRWGVPVSTTHVSCGALFGLGATTGQARWRTIAAIALAWVVTLPVAAALAAATFVVLRP